MGKENKKKSDKNPPKGNLQSRFNLWIDQSKNKVVSEESKMNQRYLDLFQPLGFIAKGGFGACSKVIHYDSGLILVQKIGLIEKMDNQKYINYMENEAEILK